MSLRNSLSYSMISITVNRRSILELIGSGVLRRFGVVVHHRNDLHVCRAGLSRWLIRRLDRRWCKFQFWIYFSAFWVMPGLLALRHSHRHQGLIWECVALGLCWFTNKPVRVGHESFVWLCVSKSDLVLRSVGWSLAVNWFCFLIICRTNGFSHFLVIHVFTYSHFTHSHL